jgi:hypothetical protein
MRGRRDAPAPRDPGSRPRRRPWPGVRRLKRKGLRTFQANAGISCAAVSHFAVFPANAGISCAPMAYSPRSRACRSPSSRPVSEAREGRDPAVCIRKSRSGRMQGPDSGCRLAAAPAALAGSTATEAQGPSQPYSLRLGHLMRRGQPLRCIPCERRDLLRTHGVFPAFASVSSSVIAARERSA